MSRHGYGPDGLRLDDPMSSVSERDPFLSRGAHARGTRYDGAGSSPATYGHRQQYGPDGLKLDDPMSSGLPPGLSPGGGAFDPEQARREKPTNRHFHGLSIAAKVFVPWCVFFLVTCTLALSPPTALFRIAAYVVVLCAVGFTGILLHLSGRPGPESTFYYHLGILSLLSVVVGVALGMQVHDRDMSQFWMYNSGSEYTNVSASAPSASFTDAGSLIFDASARVDLRRPFGMRPPGTSETFCVAPILDESEVARVQFWAVGRDCCEPFWGFRCDKSRDPSAHAGVVLTEGSSAFAGQLYERYRTAAKQAAATYNLYTPDKPVFVRWLATTTEVRGDILRHCLVWLLVTSLIYLMVCAFVAGWLHLSQQRAHRGRLTPWSAFDRPR